MTDIIDQANDVAQQSIERAEIKNIDFDFEMDLVITDFSVKDKNDDWFSLPTL